MAEERKKLTVPDLRARKKAGEKVVMASIPDYPSAVWAERAGIDIAAVGDSLGMVSYGHPEHAAGHRRHDDPARSGGAPRRAELHDPGRRCPTAATRRRTSACVNAMRLMKEGGADVVKMQGGKEKAPIIKAIADAGVPVMSHVGMCPHFMHQYGGFKLQGKTADEAMRIIEDGIAIEEAGAVGFEIEAVPAPVAKAVDDAVDIFTFAIGAGPASCGQLLLAFDLLGVFDQFKPKFTKRYAQISEVAVDALQGVCERSSRRQVSRRGPSYGMKPEEEEKLRQAGEAAQNVTEHGSAADEPPAVTYHAKLMA